MSLPITSSLDLVRQVLGQYSDAAPETVLPEAELAALNVDSLTLAEMLFALEDHLGVTMPEPAERPRLVADMMALVEPYMDQIRTKVAA